MFQTLIALAHTSLTNKPKFLTQVRDNPSKAERDALAWADHHRAFAAEHGDAAHTWSSLAQVKQDKKDHAAAAKYHQISQLHQELRAAHHQAAAHLDKQRLPNG
jgi:hypothetical protein